MEQLTVHIIKAVKRPDRYEKAHSLIEVLSYCMAEYSGASLDCYTSNTVYRITQTAFIDYLREASNPAFTMYQFFDSLALQEHYMSQASLCDRLSTAMLSVFQLCDVRDDNGNSLPGFENLFEGGNSAI